jgi:hypothetical protein
MTGPLAASAEAAEQQVEAALAVFVEASREIDRAEQRVETEEQRAVREPWSNSRRRSQVLPSSSDSPA